MVKSSTNSLANAVGEDARTDLRKKSVLVVDDNVDAALMMAMFLQAYGVETAVENHPIAALERSENETFDVFVLDIGLPEIDGHELARRLLQRPGNAASVFVALTGYGTEDDKRKSAAAGFHYHFVKPLNFDRFLRLFPWLAKW
jgi:CheY-like chemotaxis protein